MDLINQPTRAYINVRLYVLLGKGRKEVESGVGECK